MSNKFCTVYLIFAALINTANADANANNMATNFMLINNYDLPEYSNIWDRMRQGFKLSHKENDKVKYYEKLYTKNPKAFNQLINNAKPYLYYILTQTEKNGMPSEIALIPAVESSFNPRAENPTDAYAGMWQFIPSTGKQFSLQQNDDFDDRQNIIKSTKAAITHLNYLYAMFKQWDVAIGAYNWGEGSMYRAILSSNQNIGNINYNTLPLRQITANYVPKIIALSNIIENPHKFGVTLDTATNQPYFAITSLTTTTSIKDLHQIANIDKDTFISLNPQFKNNNYTLRPNEQIALPIKNQNIYYANANINDTKNINNSNIPPSITTPATHNNIVDVRMMSNDTNSNANNFNADTDYNTNNSNNTNNNDSTGTDELMDAVYQIDAQSLNNTNIDNAAQSKNTQLILEKNMANLTGVSHEDNTAQDDGSLDSLINSLDQK
jgi:membrane-bound lytic murein transglycosylase D